MKTRIKQLAGKKDRSAHWIMRQAILTYVEQEEAREDFKQEALAAWRQHQETGLRADQATVQQWLFTWGTPDESTAPKCHE